MSATVFILAFQIVLPLGLLAWLAILPGMSFVGFATQALGIGFLLLALALAALWTMPPWWVPILYGCLWAIAVLAGLFRLRGLFCRMVSMGILGLCNLLLFAALGVCGVYISITALAARSLPDLPVVDISMPLGPGTYIVASGGSRELVNGHMKTLDPSVERFKAWRGQSYGIDVIMIDEFGLRAAGWQPADPAAYRIFGTPIYSPCFDSVVAAVDAFSDMPVPIMDREHMLGNHVIVDCGPFVLVLAHMKKGSVRVSAGDAVTMGMPLGEVGNSGNSSEPHLHMHAQRSAPLVDPISAEPFALRVGGRVLVRNDRIVVK